MSSFDSYVGGGDDLSGASNRPFDSDGYIGYDPRLPSQRFESFSMSEGFSDDHFPPVDESKELDDDYKGINGFDPIRDEVPPPYESPFDDDLAGGQSPGMSPSTFGQSFESGRQSEFAPADEFSPTVQSNGKGFGPEEVDGLYEFSQPASLNGAVLPPPEEMQSEEGFVLREWKRKNAILLEEKATKEREKLSQIIDAADSYKDEYYEKRRNHCETSKKNNREKEKVFLENHEKFHATADQHYWKAVAELIPHELPSMEMKSRGGKDKKKTTAFINQGPKPGKPTDVTRMRQVLVKLKHNPPAHMKAPPPPPPPTAAPAPPEAAGATPPPSGAPAPPSPQRQGSGAQAVAGA